MGNGTVYSEAFRTKMVERMLSPNARSMRAIGRDAGVPAATLYRWRNEATLAKMSRRSTEPPQSPRDWTAEEKLAVVLEAAGIPEAELGAYLRTKGVHEAQLREWRQQALAGLQGKAGDRAASKEDARRVRQLERELNRKDKALAEAAALLVLKKKAQEIWGDEDDDTDPKKGE